MDEFSCFLKKLNKKKIAIITGGTAGHIFPAIILAKYLQCDLYNNNGRYLNYYQKTKFVEIKRSFNIFKQIKYILQYMKILYKYDCIITFGGFPTAPAVVAAFLLQKPRFCHEQNSKLGFVNIIATFLNFQLLSSFKMQNDLHIGLPIAKEKQEMIDKNLKYVLVLAGSLCSSFFDFSVAPIVGKFCQENNLKLFFQSKNLELIKPHMPGQYCVRDFFEDFEALIHDAQLVVCRAGASTVAYMHKYEKKCIIIPLQNSSMNHQLLNAKKSNYPYIEEKDIDVLKEKIKDVFFAKNLKTDESSLKILSL